MIYCCEFDDSRVTEEAYKLRRGAVFYYRSNIVLRGWTMKRAVSRAGAMLALWMVLAGAAQARGAEPWRASRWGRWDTRRWCRSFCWRVLHAEGGFCGCGPSAGYVWVAPVDGAPAGRSGGRRPDGRRGGGGAADGQGAGADPVAAARPRAVPVGAGAWEVPVAGARPAVGDCADGGGRGGRTRSARRRCCISSGTSWH